MKPFYFGDKALWVNHMVKMKICIARKLICLHQSKKNKSNNTEAFSLLTKHIKVELLQVLRS